ncbi:permease-like cell division protein FtsX [Nonomuraea spiralis]|uniref:permease-like cell division protein FtsX n=1 Tax=Nonomuraea spiralis TaxID=46182 RepID=UPI00379427EF
MKRWLWRVAVAAVVAFSGMAAQVVPAGAEPVPGNDREIAVFLCTPSAADCGKRYATAKQRRDVETFLRAMPEVTEVRFVSREASYQALRREFAGKEKVRAKDLPESFRVRVTEAADRRRIATSARSRPGVALVVDQAKQHVEAASPFQLVEVSVFLCMRDAADPGCRHGRGKANKAAATAKEKKAIVAFVERIPGLESYEFEDQKTAYRNFAEMYAANPALVEAVRESDMPESYRLRLRPGVRWGSSRTRLAGMPGVSQVFDYGCRQKDLRLLTEYGLRGIETATKGCE